MCWEWGWGPQKWRIRGGWTPNVVKHIWTPSWDQWAPNGSHGSPNGSSWSQCYINEGYNMTQALPCLLERDKTSSKPWISSQVSGAMHGWIGNMVQVNHRISITGVWTCNVVVLKKPMVWQLILCNVGGPWISTVILQVPLCPYRGIGPYIGIPSPWWRPTCNLV